MTTIPKTHPRYLSLKTREQIAQGVKQGLVHTTGLIAHGRGEAFDYLIGETTIPPAVLATQCAAAVLLLSKNPVISINGNVAVLAAKDCIKLAQLIPAKIEVNLFHRTSDRMKKIIDYMIKSGASKIYGKKGDAQIPGLTHNRGICDKEGIYAADVILVPLEDGDRCAALKKMGKTVITIDLNPLSRTARTADITIVDNLIRALPHLQNHVVELKKQDQILMKGIVDKWDNAKNLHNTCEFMAKRLNSLA